MINPSAEPTRWTREQIRCARQAPLVPLLKRRGLRLIERPEDNFEPVDYPGLIVKESYWRWPEQDLAGNSIDFLVEIFGRSFHDAMREIVGS